MKKKITSLIFCALLFALCLPAQAQQPKKIVQIGYLSPRSAPTALVAFKEGLRELGWVEGKQVKFEYRYAGDQIDKLTNFATELVRLRVDVIVAGPGNGAAIAAKRATTTIPIVMVMVVDPVSNGLVASLARPGANVTGLSFDVTQEQAGKNLELLKEAVPKVSRVAVLRNPNIRSHMAYSKEAERAAKILGVTIQFAEMQALNDKNLEDALSAVVRERANALLVTPQTFFLDRRQRLLILPLGTSCRQSILVAVLLMPVVSCRTARTVKTCGGGLLPTWIRF